MKILVAIACYGSKNLKYLDVLLSEYRRMPFPVDIVVLSNEPKSLDSKVEVLVGLPAKNPRSLPFGHKALFSQRIKDYDLFVYTEDDTLITEKNIRTFLDSTRLLPGNQIPGFLRYETAPNGSRHISSAHGRFHWRPESVKQVGGEVFAQFTNDHSACFILTHEQLERAIASGGFLVEPYEGQYGMLETAATDPYTRCGFAKVVNISRIEDFLLPHLPNTYVGVMGAEYSVFMAQVEALKQIATGKRPATRALPKLQAPCAPPWIKSYYEPCSDELISLVPEGAQSILSLAIGTGLTESELVRLGYDVTAIPLDSAICVPAEPKGVKMVHCELMQGPEKLQKNRFDCLLINNLLYLLEDPIAVILAFSRLLTDSGCLLIKEPNFGNIQTHGGRLLKKQAFRGLESFSRSRVTPVTTGRLRTWLKAAGFKIRTIVPIGEAGASRRVQILQTRLLRFSSDSFAVAAYRRP